MSLQHDIGVGAKSASSGHQDDERAAMFTLLSSSSPGASSQGSARLGRLLVQGRTPLLTPHYVGITSRGVIPHLSQDTFAKHTQLGGVYIALEDFIENHPRKQPPLLKLHGHQQEKEANGCGSALRKFISLPDETLMILGARRTPPVPTPTPNSHVSMSIYTSVGFQQLAAEDYIAMCAKLRPDIVVGLGDITYGDKPGRRRVEKMSGRTERWAKQMWEHRRRLRGQQEQHSPAALFAPVLPIEFEQQSIYLGVLAEDLADDIAGLAFYEAESVSCVAGLPSLEHLPRLALTEAAEPHAVLREIALGMDLFTLPFIGAATDAGIALDFSFPAPSSCDGEAVVVAAATAKRPLGIDMWQAEHARSLAPLAAGCGCLACTAHHRAYIQHLLNAKEMLAWVLLQLHNLRVVDCFFAGVRACLAMSDRDGDGSDCGNSADKGQSAFEQEVQRFAAVYEPQLPAKTGSTPRVRGYQYKSEGPAEARRNPLAFERFDASPATTTAVQSSTAEAAMGNLATAAILNEEADMAAASGANAMELEKQGFAKRV